MRRWLKVQLVCRWLHRWYVTPVYGSWSRNGCSSCKNLWPDPPTR